jgi:SAM-dependent methyltransferase
VTGTWHHGIVATWWDEFNRDGPEIDFFRRYVEEAQPSLDAGCGTGRLLLPFLRAGLDVDGCDVSPDMVERCRARAEAEGLSASLYVQALRDLDLPRRYRTIVVCGAFGLGSTREDDREGLRRIHAHLEPGGRLVLDNEVPYADLAQWALWPKGERSGLPGPERERDPSRRRRASDGLDYELRARLLALDPLAQTCRYEMKASKWRGDELVAEEEHSLDMTLYFTHELVLMLEQAGFAKVELRAGYRDEPPTPDDDFVVFVATRP